MDYQFIKDFDLFDLEAQKLSFVNFSNLLILFSLAMKSYSKHFLLLNFMSHMSSRMIYLPPPWISQSITHLVLFYASILHQTSQANQRNLNKSAVCFRYLFTLNSLLFSYFSYLNISLFHFLSNP